MLMRSRPAGSLAERSADPAGWARQIEDLAKVLPRDDAGVTTGERSREAGMVVEPGRGEARQHQELGAGRPHLLGRRERIGAGGICAGAVAWERPGLAFAELEQRSNVGAGDRDRAPGGQQAVQKAAQLAGGRRPQRVKKRAAKGCDARIALEM